MPDQPDDRSMVRKAWDAVAGTVSGWWNGAKETVTNTYNRATQAVTDAEQRALDTVDDVKHPVYTAARKGLCAVFGKAAVKWGVDEVMSVFGHDNKDVNAFGSGTFMAEMQKWQRQFDRDPELHKSAPAPAPA